ncbi:M20 family peptidase [Candidatus Bathyarchaeota archaeon]|nr:M20 family metallopeptidase [Candidatus Bathyarchaeota archaeon]RJS83626.1 MAG: M20 family peptidase [Candidatus Bathyarchaeota archaeon]RLG98188.1 MAG: M20 family peptidase [Candidatus Bathyarchaeota archaeon]HDN62710.1 M20 family peptidase [Candidatus Bathyarchaeota archaeon]
MSKEEFKRKALSQIEDDEVIKLLQDAVRIPSHKDLPDQEKEMAEFFASWFDKRGIEVELQRVEGPRQNVIARVRGEGDGSTLMYNSHLDTKPPYNMTIEPYDPVIKDGNLYGRGSVDAKAQLAAFASALLAVKRAKIPLRGDLIFTGVVGEEWDSKGTSYIAKNGPKADMAVVGEPTKLEICIAHKGIVRATITTIGKAAHSSVPHLGINAISKMGKVIRAIEEELPKKLEGKSHPLLGKSTYSLGVINGGVQPSIVPDKCSLTVDLRVLPGIWIEDVKEYFEEILEKIKREDPEFKAELSMSSRQPPLDTSESHPIVQALKRSVNEIVGRMPKVTGAPFDTDASILANAGIPSVVCGAGDVRYAHAAVELVPVGEVIAAAKIFTLTAVEICC